MVKRIIYSVCFIVCFSKGQTIRNDSIPSKLLQTILMTRIELTDLNNKTFLSIGTKIPIDRNNYIGVRGHFNWWDESNRKFLVIPELEYIRKITSYPMIVHKTIVTDFYASGGISLNSISPKLGIICYRFFSIEIGYNFDFKDYSYFQTKGFRFSVGINIFKDDLN